MASTNQTSDAPAFMTAGRRAVRVSNQTLVKSSPLDGAGQALLLIEPVVGGLSLAAWAAANRESLEEQLLRHGALLFRGFDVQTAEEFGQSVQALAGEPLAYRERSSPRSSVSEGVYSSTDYPADQSIFLHNENSYQSSWPLRILFYCLTPPAHGGETPIASCRRVYARLSAKTRERFAAKGCMYVRNYGEGCGLPWQTVFQTDDRGVVEAYCAEHELEFEWKGAAALRTRAVRPAIVRHPRTGEDVWFNHATFFHVSTLAEPLREALLAQFAEQDLPNNTYYGDGSPIEPEVLDELRAAYLEETISFPWQRGDVLFLDNVLTAHGRRPFVGERRILVGMAQPFSWREVQAVTTPRG